MYTVTLPCGCVFLCSMNAINIGVTNPAVTPSKLATTSKNSALLLTIYNCRYSSKIPSNTKYIQTIRKLFFIYDWSIIRRIRIPIKSETRKKSKKCPTLSVPKTRLYFMFNLITLSGLWTERGRYKHYWI